MKFGKVGSPSQIRPAGPLQIRGKFGKAMLVSAIAFAVATIFTACNRTLTVDFLFVTTTKQSPGQVEVYEVNSESGGLRTIPASPFPSGGRNPVAEVAGVDYKNLYVVNRDDNNIVQFGIGTDGKLYPQNTVNTPGSFPSAVTINSAGTFLYVLDTLSPVPGCSLANACPGDLAVFPINKDGSLGSPIANPNTKYPTYWPLLKSPTDATTVLTPTSVNVLANNNAVYVSAYDPAASKGYVFGFTAHSDGTLTAMNGSAPLGIGAQPIAVASDPGSSFLYVVDQLNGTLSSFAVSALAAGSTAATSEAATGNQPSSLTVDGSKYVYVANGGDSTVSSYGVSSGSLNPLSTTATTDTNPVAITVDPRKLGYMYTVNFLGSSLSGFIRNASDGSLVNAQHTPYASTAQPTAIAGIPHSGTTTSVTGQ